MSRSSSTGFTAGQVFKAWCWTYLPTSNVQYSLAVFVNAKPPLLSLSLRSISLLPGLVLFLGCQNYGDRKNGCAGGTWILQEKKLGVSGLSLAQAFNQLSTWTSNVLRYVFRYVLSNCSNVWESKLWRWQKNGVHRWEELLEEEEN